MLGQKSSPLSAHRQPSGRADALVHAADCALRTLLAPPVATRPFPETQDWRPTAALSEPETRLSGALMRVNHVGEVCAQALYTSQALGARIISDDARLANHLEHASREETDHLAWTESRIAELGTHKSYLNPLWYAGAFGLGLAASAFGRKVSLGFVVETERQVESHLESHLQALPETDQRSRAIVSAMKTDEAAHANAAQLLGAVELPRPIQWLMQRAACVMTTVAHRI